jgi:hypothetical protein
MSTTLRQKFSFSPFGVKGIFIGLLIIAVGPTVASASPEASLKLKSTATETKNEAKTPSASEVKFKGPAVVGSEQLENKMGWGRFSGSASLQYSLKAYNSPDAEDRDEYAYTFHLNYKLNNLYSTGVSAAIYNNVDETQEQDQLKIKSVAVNASRVAYDLLHGYSLRPSLGLRLPVGRDTEERESLRFGVSPSANLTMPAAAWTNLPKLSAGFNLSALYNVHRYKESATGRSNMQYGLTPAFRVGYDLPKDFSASASLAYTSSWTYEGTQVEILEHSESLDWAFWEHASASVGHSNRAPLFSYAGVNYDYSLISERSSYFFGELTVSF